MPQMLLWKLHWEGPRSRVNIIPVLIVLIKSSIHCQLFLGRWNACCPIAPNQWMAETFFLVLLVNIAFENWHENGVCHMRLHLTETTFSCLFFLVQFCQRTVKPSTLTFWSLMFIFCPKTLPASLISAWRNILTGLFHIQLICM